MATISEEESSKRPTRTSNIGQTTHQIRTSEALLEELISQTKLKTTNLLKMGNSKCSILFKDRFLKSSFRSKFKS